MTDLAMLATAFEDALMPHRMRLLFDAARPPIEPRAALLGVDGSPIGSVLPSLAERMWEAGLPLRSARQGGRAAPGAQMGALAGRGGFDVVDHRLEPWQIVATGPGEPTSAVLATLARWLADQGQAGRWRNELLAVTDAQGREHGRIERCVVRPLGITTFAVHLVGFTPQGLQWVQQRALDKATDPGLWDTLMGGQRGAGETVADTLERETWEEAGLRMAALGPVQGAGRLTLRRPVDEGYLVEHIDLFETVVPDRLVPNNRDGEVAQFQRRTPAEIAEQVGQGLFTLEAGLMMARTTT
jgi:8-oxo-dGTP pyrophosphatase MutT (NUDIX family)